jgi:hypothetical protein
VAILQTNVPQIPLLSYCDRLGRRMTFRRPRTVKSSHKDFMRAVEAEFAKFERNERAFRHADREERVAKLMLPFNHHKPFARNEERVFESMKDHV